MRETISARASEGSSGEGDLGKDDKGRATFRESDARQADLHKEEGGVVDWLAGRAKMMGGREGEGLVWHDAGFLKAIGGVEW